MYMGEVLEQLLLSVGNTHLEYEFRKRKKNEFFLSIILMEIFPHIQLTHKNTEDLLGSTHVWSVNLSLFIWVKRQTDSTTHMELDTLLHSHY